MVRAFVAAVCMLFGTVVPASAVASGPLYVLIDASGSMAGGGPGEGSKLRVAEALVREEIASVSPDGQVSITYLGGENGGSCTTPVQITPLGSGPHTLEPMQAAGSTPIASALLALSESATSGPGRILLITDGADTCGGDVCAAWAQLQGQRPELRMDVRLLLPDRSDQDALGCLALSESSQRTDPIVLRTLDAPSLVQQVKPWVDLLTWQVVALLGGIALLPALYNLLKRLRSVKVGGSEAVLDPGKVKKMEEDASESADRETTEQAAKQIESLQDEQPGDAEKRFEKILQAWARIQKLAKVKAQRFGGQDARAVIPNLTLLANKFPNDFSLDDVNWAQQLRDELKSYEGNLGELTASAYRGFAISAGRLAKRIERIPDQSNSK